jgi:UDP-sulfoquinovose synthase
VELVFGAKGEKMRVLILGADGYLGWPTAMNLSALGYEVYALDSYFRRTACHQLDVEPLLPVANLHRRAQSWQEKTGRNIHVAIGDITDYPFLSDCFTGKAFKDDQGNWSPPDAVIDYAEQPSAPYSMIGREHAAFTLRNNLIGTCNLVHAVKEYNPSCHIIKLGTMGVYGTPNIDIEEGYIEVSHKGRKHTFLYPKAPGSLYHITKAQDGDMLYFYCRMWDIRVTDLNQGPVYGIFTNESNNDEGLATIFNYDDIFGTVLNRFLVQAACGHPLTVFGKGGQTRGYLNIIDTLQCVELCLRQPANPGQYRVFNQFVETFSVNELAERVRGVGAKAGLDVRIQAIENPRKEAEDHYYNPVHTGLLDIGLKPHYLTEDLLADMLNVILKYKSNINMKSIMPRVRWK